MSWEPGPAWLFCPANRPDRYQKALQFADVVILDLEDAVAAAEKNAARSAVKNLVQTGTYDRSRTVLRINGALSPEHAADRSLVTELDIDRVMLAKAEHPHDVSALGERGVIPLVETPAGVEWAGALAEASNTIGLMWGADDLVAATGGNSSRRRDGTYRDVVRYARSRTLIAAKACNHLALDNVFMDIDDSDGLREESEESASVGFNAKAAIHPSQVLTVRAAFAPSRERVEWARRLLHATEEQPGVAVFEGRMVDEPIYRQARRTLELAQQMGAGEGRHE